MPMHNYHPRDDTTPILFDGCPRCEEHAENLFDLDGSFIEKLWQRMIQVETNVGGNVEYRSHNEAKACKKLFTFYLLLERYGHPSLNLQNLFLSNPSGE